MPYTIEWPEVALRLLLTVVAGAFLGMNRSEHGHAAGLRTTLLVCLAASVSMLQVNLLLPVSGKTSGSFAVLDLMRLPLGILSGMGFIGAGAIVRKGDLVRGLTTAASLWFATVLGLCFGGGQLLLGSTVLALGVIVLEGLKWVEKRRKQDRHAKLVIAMAQGGPTDDEVAVSLQEKGYDIETWAVSYTDQGSKRELAIELRWRAYPHDIQPPPFLHNLVDRSGVVKVEWNP